ncbi:MAG: hypothetical protein M3Z04_18870 [Chloroflexota bacterium]|nr:hypothetical protein [Chloroflexota bacterium]
MSKLDRARQALERAIAAIDVALPGAGPTALGPHSHAQLLRFRANLVAMLADLAACAAHPPSLAVPSLGHIIADSWPLDSPLGEAILAAEQEYESCAKSAGRH